MAVTAPRVGFAAGEGNDYTPTPSELRTGKRWVDGRPIYQKTLMVVPQNLSSITGGSQMTHGTANIDTVVEIEGVIRSGNNFYPSGSDIWHPRATATHLVLMHSASLAGHDGWVTMYYTRSTDPVVSP